MGMSQLFFPQKIQSNKWHNILGWLSEKWVRINYEVIKKLGKLGKLADLGLLGNLCKNINLSVSFRYKNSPSSVVSKKP